VNLDPSPWKGRTQMQGVEKKMLRRIPGPEIDEVRRNRRTSLNEELHNL
jgi:hypothetical protein